MTSRGHAVTFTLRPPHHSCWHFRDEFQICVISPILYLSGSLLIANRSLRLSALTATFTLCLMNVPEHWGKWSLQGAWTAWGWINTSWSSAITAMIYRTETQLWQSSDHLITLLNWCQRSNCLFLSSNCDALTQMNNWQGRKSSVHHDKTW